MLSQRKQATLSDPTELLLTGLQRQPRSFLRTSKKKLKAVAVVNLPILGEITNKGSSLSKTQCYEEVNYYT